MTEVVVQWHEGVADFSAGLRSALEKETGKKLNAPYFSGGALHADGYYGFMSADETIVRIPGGVFQQAEQRLFDEYLELVPPVRGVVEAFTRFVRMGVRVSTVSRAGLSRPQGTLMSQHLKRRFLNRHGLGELAAHVLHVRRPELTGAFDRARVIVDSDRERLKASLAHTRARGVWLRPHPQSVGGGFDLMVGQPDLRIVECIGWEGFPFHLLDLKAA